MPFQSLLAVGDTLPSFDVVTLQGEHVSTGDLLDRGCPLMLVFFTTTCGDCQRQLPEVQRLVDDHRHPDAASPASQVLCIGRSQPAQVVEAFWAQQALTLPCAPQADDTLYRRFARSGVPRIYLFDARGIVRYVSNPEQLLPAERLAEILHEHDCF